MCVSLEQLAASGRTASQVSAVCVWLICMPCNCHHWALYNRLCAWSLTLTLETPLSPFHKTVAAAAALDFQQKFECCFPESLSAWVCWTTASLLFCSSAGALLVLVSPWHARALIDTACVCAKFYVSWVRCLCCLRCRANCSKVGRPRLLQTWSDTWYLPKQWWQAGLSDRCTTCIAN